MQFCIQVVHTLGACVHGMGGLAFIYKVQFRYYLDLRVLGCYTYIPGECLLDGVCILTSHHKQPGGNVYMHQYLYSIGIKGIDRQDHCMLIILLRVCRIHWYSFQNGVP